MQVGTVVAGRIGLAILRRLKPFDVKLHYTIGIGLRCPSRRNST
jgi:lactate dehydrogenase-like 2-hydroxyacid dehydrogenase